MDPPYVRMGDATEAAALAREPGPWMVGNLKQSIGWTERPVTIAHAGHAFLLLPEDERFLPCIALKGEDDDARRLILEFASALAWSMSGDVTVQSWSGGGHLIRAAKSQQPFGQITAMNFHVSYLPALATENQKLALALFHEGISLSRVHVAYSFLSFYKIVNLVSGSNGNQQMTWMNAHIGQISNHVTSERLKQLNDGGEDLGRYLYQSCRCAIAHAGDPRNPVIDPHDVVDQKRLRSDLPLVIELAKVAIEEELGVKTSRTVYREHLYELSGFEDYLDADLVRQMKAGLTPESGSVALPSRFSLRMWGKAPYSPLTNMIVESCTGSDGVLAVRCKSQSGRILADVVLDFPEYRLRAQLTMSEPDDGSVEYIDELMETERFVWDYNGNGSLEVWSEEGDCLARSDPFIPLNMFPLPDRYAQRLAELRSEAERRRGSTN